MSKTNPGEGPGYSGLVRRLFQIQNHPLGPHNDPGLKGQNSKKKSDTIMCFKDINKKNLTELICLNVNVFASRN
jgi:hypothetical protein